MNQPDRFAEIKELGHVHLRGVPLVQRRYVKTSFSELQNGSGIGHGNWAIGALFDRNAKESNCFNADALALYNAALSLAAKLPRLFHQLRDLHANPRDPVLQKVRTSAGIHWL